MKNEFWKFSAKFVLSAVASLLLAVFLLAAAAYATYKIFDIEELRWTMKLLYYFFDFLSSYSLYLVMLLALLLALFINHLFTRRATRRMDAVLAAVAQIQNGEYNVLLPNDNKEALGELERSINALAIQINDTFVQRKEIEQSKDDFIVNIAHDLRTPLTSILGYLSFISEKQLAAELSAKYAGIALEKAAQLEKLIDALFDIAHLAMDSAETSKEELNLKKFLLQKQDEFYPLTSAAGMELRLNISDSAQAIRADGALLARVFDNLLNNAIRYAKEGRFIDIEAEGLGGTVRISFITHANPVPVGELEKIFDKLYRLEKSRASGTGGTGLGLSISRRIIELHGGTLTARQAGDGTAFDIFLPE